LQTYDLCVENYFLNFGQLVADAFTIPVYDVQRRPGGIIISCCDVGLGV